MSKQTFMSLNKKTAIPLILLTALIILFLLFRVTVNILLPENIVSEKVHAVFKTSFSKSINFDRLYISYSANIILENFQMSNSTDFNDNKNLIKSKKVIINTSFINLVKGNIEFTGIKFKSPEINIIKSSGKNYKETFSELFTTNTEIDKLPSYIKKRLLFQFHDSTIVYKETFKNSRTELRITNLNAKIFFNEEQIDFNVNGKITSKSGEKNFTGNISSKGFYNFANLNYSNKSDFEQIDLEYINNFVYEKNSIPFTFSGLLSGEIALKCNDDKIKCDSSISLHSLSSMYKEKEAPYKIISNENVEAEIKLALSRDYSNINIEKINIDNGILKADISGNYEKGLGFSTKFNTNNINFDKLSEHLILFKNHKYKGAGKIEGELEYNIAEKKPSVLNFELLLKNFNLIPKTNEVNTIKISQLNTELKADISSVSCKSGFIINGSDFSTEINSSINRWYPFKSDTNIKIESKRVELALLKKYAFLFISDLYQAGFADLARGYDERSFLNNPEGILINNNNININIKSENLLIAGKADLKDFSMDLALNNGFIRTNSFNLQGYDGKYSGNIYCVLKQAYPYIKIEASGSGLNLDSIIKDAAFDYTGGGILNFDLSYETNAFRVAHFVQNGRGGINFDIKKGHLAGTDFQKKLSSFIATKGYGETSINNLDIDSFTFGFSQAGANFYIKNLGMRSNRLYFQTYGNYKYPNNLSVPFSISVKTEEYKTVTVPLLIFNSPANPCIKINLRKDEDKICFNLLNQ